MSGESGRAAPRRILVAGDWHGNEDWALSVIRRAQSTLARESPRLILQLGDFGVWPDRAGQDYLARVSKAAGRGGGRAVVHRRQPRGLPATRPAGQRHHPGRARGGAAPAVPPAPRLPLDLARAALAGLRRRGEPGPGAAHRGRGLVAGGGDHRRAGGRDHRRRPRGRAGQPRLPVRVSRTRSAARRPGGIRPTWPATTRTGGGCSASWTPSSRPGSCTATCTGPISGAATSATGRSR